MNSKSSPWLNIEVIDVGCLQMRISDANIELHVHPFLGNNSLVDVVETADRNNLDILALESFDLSLYPDVVRQAKEYYPDSTFDEAGVRLPNGKYLLNAREYGTKEDIHVLTIGYSFDKADPVTEIRKIIDLGLEHKALVILDHPFVDNGITRTAGHISENTERELGELCREYSGNIALEWNGYCIPWIRRGLKFVLNLMGQKVQYYDVNKKVEELSEKLHRDGYNVPVLVDTDLHARSKRQLSEMGTARLIMDVEGECASDTVCSMKKNIFAGNYENVKKYVSSFHLLGAFCLPVLFPWYFDKARG